MTSAADAYDDLMSFARQLADTARPVSMRYFRQRLSIDQKTDDSPVTVADRNTETALRDLIRQRFPEHGIYGEEHGQTRLDQRLIWVLDPIDGTKSFITGTPLFGTLIALLDAGVPKVGVIDMPALNERWIGADGNSEFNGERCQTRSCRTLAEASLALTTPDMFDQTDGQRFQKVADRVRFRRFGGDCYNYGLLASGFIDLVIEADTQPYDYLPLVTIIEGAGGVISDWDGNPLGLNSDGRVVAAATAELHHQALTLLNG